MYDTDMTSDILIYNVLRNSEDEWINHCRLKFWDRSVPAEADDTIYIANIDLETRDETFNGTEYKALVEVYVKTKNTDYLKASRFLRTVVKHIKHELRENEECKERFITFRNINYEYGSKYSLKGLHLAVQLLESEDYDLNDDYTCFNFHDTDLEIINE